MREIRLSGSEGGVALITPSLPLSFRGKAKIAARHWFMVDGARNFYRLSVWLESP
jgi:hypothetical protein